MLLHIHRLELQRTTDWAEQLDDRSEAWENLVTLDGVEPLEPYITASDTSEEVSTI